MSTDIDREQIRIYELPISDASNQNFEINITDGVADDSGQDIVSFMRNRDLTSSWITTGSDDSANTIIESVISDSSTVSDIFLIGHNFKDFDIDYWNGVAYVSFDSITDNEETFYHLDIDSPVITTKVRITAYATIIADSDKQITRLLITNKIESGQFDSYPTIERPTQGTIKKTSTMLSGKKFISESLGAFSVRLNWKGVTTQEDVDIIERMFLGRTAFMIWINGGSDNQFRFKLTGYRKQDFYIVKPTEDYMNAFYKGIYSLMVPQAIGLAEVVD